MKNRFPRTNPNHNKNSLSEVKTRRYHYNKNTKQQNKTTNHQDFKSTMSKCKKVSERPNFKIS